jgi:hypothetical protein
VNKSGNRNTVDSNGSLSLFFGWWALLCYVSLGITLEVLHGLKIGWYLEIETRRLMWTLGHAHGGLLALVNVVFGIMLRVMGENSRWQHSATICLLLATVLLPRGFFLAGIRVYESDPGVGIFLVPLGAVFLFVGVLLTAMNARFPSHGFSPLPEEGGDAKPETADPTTGTQGPRWE